MALIHGNWQLYIDKEERRREKETSIQVASGNLDFGNIGLQFISLNYSCETTIIICSVRFSWSSGPKFHTFIPKKSNTPKFKTLNNVNFPNNQHIINIGHNNHVVLSPMDEN